MRLLLLLLSFAPLLLASCEPASRDRAAPPLLLFGRTGAGEVEFNYPRAAEFGPDGLLVVVDKGGRVQTLTAAGQFVRAWRMPAIDAGKPTGIGIAADGAVFAADTHYARVVVFEPDGRIRATIGSYGDGPSQFRLPTDVVVSAAGEIFVSEYGGNDRISRYDAAWRFVASFNGTERGGQRMARPQSLRFDAQGLLWVADVGNHRVCAFTVDGELRHAFGALGDEPGALRFPYAVEPLSDGTLVVAEYGNNRVQRFSRDGVSLGTWGRAGRAPGELAYPWAVARDAQDRVYVVDSGNNRIQVIDATRPDVWARP